MSLRGRRKRALGRGGFTLLEISMVSFVLILTIVAISSVWFSMNRQLRFLRDRISLLQEAQAARSLLTSDWQRGTNASVVSGSELVLEFPADSESAYLVDGTTHYSHAAGYSTSGTTLVRDDHGGSNAGTGLWSMTAANDINTTNGVAFSYASGPLMYATLSFQRNGLTSSMNALLVNCGLLQGHADCGILFPAFYYDEFSPITNNIVYSSVTQVAQSLGLGP